MVKNKAWKEDEDNLIINTVKEIKDEGGFLKEAFEIVAGKTNRTPGSVAFRWNNKVKKESGFESKKKQKEVIKRTEEKKAEAQKEEGLTVEDVIKFLNNKKSDIEGYDVLKKEYEELDSKYNLLEKKFEHIKETINQFKET